MDSITTLLRELQTQKSQTNLNRSNLLRDNYYLYIYLLKASMYKTNFLSFIGKSVHQMEDSALEIKDL